MYIERHIDSQLQDWKNSNPHKPLLLRGARQVGKSCAIRHLGESFEHYIEVNLEKRPEVITLFQREKDVRKLATNIGILYNTPIIEGKTLLFIDEIQVSAEAIKSLWFFKEDYPELHVIAAGSLLEFTLKKLSSFGVGRIRSLFMYPMSFDEFLVAQGKKSWIAEKKKANSNNPLFEVLHKELIELFRTYILVGGMPASVATWTKTHDFSLCQAEQDDIQLSYYDDFAKYSDEIDITLLRNTLQSVIKQTGNKFIYSRVEGGYRTDDVKKALGMLCDAGIIKRINYTSANGLPLGAGVNDKFRKYIYLDSGLLLRIMDLDFGDSREFINQILIEAASDLVNKGSLAELILGWELIKYGTPRSQYDLYYWENIMAGTSSEVDYIISRNMKVLPIECKAGTSGKMKSLRLFMKNKNLTEAIRCSLENFSKIEFTDEDKHTPKQIEIVPLYAISNL